MKKTPTINLDGAKHTHRLNVLLPASLFSLHLFAATGTGLAIISAQALLPSSGNNRGAR